MTVYQIHKSKYPGNSGDGAKQYGGRWNSQGIAAIYTASRLSLAVLEILVHYDSGLPADYAETVIQIPDDVSVLLLDSPKPGHPDVNQLLDDDANSKYFGDQWIRSQASAVLAVPSIHFREWKGAGEVNCILNPGHRDFSKIKFLPARPFALDPRLVS